MTSRAKAAKIVARPGWAVEQQVLDAAAAHVSSFAAISSGVPNMALSPAASSVVEERQAGLDVPGGAHRTRRRAAADARAVPRSPCAFCRVLATKKRARHRRPSDRTPARRLLDLGLVEAETIDHRRVDASWSSSSLQPRSRDLADRAGLPAPIQIGGCGFCDRRRLDHDVIEMPALAVMRTALRRGPGLEDDLHALVEALVGLLHGTQKPGNSP